MPSRRGRRPGLPPRAGPQLVEGAGRPRDGVEGVDGELGAGGPLRDDVGDPARAAGGDDLDAGALPLRERVEEGVELALAVPGAGPHDPSAVVVDHHGQVLAALLVAGLVDADRAQTVEAAPPVGLLERCPHAGAYPAHGTACALTRARGTPRGAGCAAAVRCRFSPSAQPTQIPEESLKMSSNEGNHQKRYKMVDVSYTGHQI